MIINTREVKIFDGYEHRFEHLCKERNMPIKPHPKYAKGSYRVIGPEEALLDIGLFIKSFKKLPFGVVYPDVGPLLLY